MKRSKKGTALRALVLESMAVAMMIYLVTPQSANDTPLHQTASTRERPQPRQPTERQVGISLRIPAAADFQPDR